MTIAAQNGYTYTIGSYSDLDDNYAVGSLTVVTPDGTYYRYDRGEYNTYCDLTLAIAKAAGIINPDLDEEEEDLNRQIGIDDLHDDIRVALNDALDEATRDYEEAANERAMRAAL